jgi:hypothetical protein
LALGYLYTASNSASVTDSIVPANNAAVPSAPTTPKSTTPAAPAAPSAN